MWVFEKKSTFFFPLKCGAESSFSLVLHEMRFIEHIGGFSLPDNF